jgi:hypothetical protein
VAVSITNQHDLKLHTPDDVGGNYAASGDSLR